MDTDVLSGATLSLGARVTVLLLASALAAVALRRATAATRHLVALAGLASALLVPLLIGSLPELDVTMLPADTPLAPHFPPWATWAVRAWALVAAALLARLGAGVLRFARITRSALPDPALAAEAARCAETLGIRRSVRVLCSERVAVPMTAGIFAARVILPDAARAWTAERRRLVLLHELAHVKRLDSLSLLIAEAAAALWWFHPLVWAARRGARLEAEKAADDLVLRAGERPTVYAHHLVELARSLREEAALAAMPMARPLNLEARLRALLEGRDRGPASAFGCALCAVLVGAAVVLSAVRPVGALVPPKCEKALAAFKRGWR